jgi:hypothetical protein
MMQDPTLPPPPASTDAPATPPLPWEDPAAGGAASFFETIHLFVMQPREAFARLGAGGIGRPLVYAIVMAWVEIVAGFLYVAVFQLPFFMVGLPELEDQLPEAMFGISFMAFIFLAVLVLAPVFVTIGLFLHTCILHLMLLILGEGKRGFETTFRALCYAHTSDLANVVPLCGGVLSLGWFVVLQIIGIAEAHRCSTAKAALAVFLPLLLCCGCIAVLLAMGVGTALLGSLAER